MMAQWHIMCDADFKHAKIDAALPHRFLAEH